MAVAITKILTNSIKASTNFANTHMHTSLPHICYMSMHMNAVMATGMACVFAAQFIAENKLTKLNLNAVQMTAGQSRNEIICSIDLSWLKFNLA